MTPEKVLQAAARADLDALAPSIFLQKWMLDRVPHVFGDDQLAFIDWKAAAAELLEVDTHALVLVGSACAGLSLAPGSNLKPFTPQSDVDVAVVSPFHFDVAWRWLRTLGAKYHGLPGNVKHWVREHQTRLVYWGAIATDQILEHLPFAERWLIAQQRLSEQELTQDRVVNFRVYRDSAALVDYHIHGIKQIRDEQIATEAAE